jgi:hypothetical protein
MIYALKALFEFPDLRSFASLMRRFLHKSLQDTLHNQDTEHDRFM